MTDLNAPLGQSGGGNRPRRVRAPRRRRISIGGIAAATTFAAFAALNVYSVIDRDRAPGTAPIMLAEAPLPEAASDPQTVGTVPAPEQRADAGVTVIDGSQQQQQMAAAPPSPSAPPSPEPIEGRISENGPKIITVRAPSAATVGQSLQLAHLPVDDALEETAAGPLPVITADGRRPMDLYARPWTTTGGKRIAVVIGGLGLSQTGTHRALEKLPPGVTLAFAPQGNSLNRWMEDARRKGHELLVQVPMEPFDYPRIDPGPQTLTVAASADENIDNLHWALGRLTNYTGIVNYQGARLMADPGAIAPVMEDLGERGLLYLNDSNAGGEALDEIARQAGVPYLRAQTVIDVTQDPAAIRKRLEQLEAIAASSGYAIGTGSALETTVDVVARWANDAKKRGFEIVGVSALAR